MARLRSQKGSTTAPLPRKRRAGDLYRSMGGLLSVAGAGSDAGLDSVFAAATRDQGASCAQILKVARSVQRQAAIGERARQARELELLDTYEKGPGQEAAHVVASALQLPPEIAVAGFPSRSGTGVRLLGCADEHLVAAMSCLSSGQQKQQLSPALDAVWDYGHRMFAEAEAPTIAEEENAVGPCLEAGICLCSPAGRELRRRAARPFNWLKFQCPHRSEKKQRLVDGYIVVRLLGGPRAYTGEVASDASHELWLHIALMYLSPYRPTWHLVEPVACSETLDDPNRVYVQSKLIFGLYIRASSP